MTMRVTCSFAAALILIMSAAAVGNINNTATEMASVFEFTMKSLDGESVDLERYRGYLAQLADPRTISETEAQDIIKDGKPIYHFMAGLPSGETGPPEMLMELAYRLAVEEGPLFDRIREQLIVTMTPAAEPDGRDRYVELFNAILHHNDFDTVRVEG